MTEFSDLELLGYAYLACCMCSFGSFAASSKPWGCREVFAATIHGGNSGAIIAMFGIKVIGLKQPWTVIGLACSFSLGWIRKADIKDMILKIFSGGGK